MNNKVVYTLFKAFLELGFITVKFNFRGVEQSEGKRNSGKDNGAGETEDVLAVVETIRNEFTAALVSPCPCCYWLAFPSVAQSRHMQRNGSGRKNGIGGASRSATQRSPHRQTRP